MRTNSQEDVILWDFFDCSTLLPWCKRAFCCVWLETSPSAWNFPQSNAENKNPGGITDKSDVTKDLIPRALEEGEGGGFHCKEWAVSKCWCSDYKVSPGIYTSAFLQWVITELKALFLLQVPSATGWFDVEQYVKLIFALRGTYSTAPESRMWWRRVLWWVEEGQV